MEIIFHDQSAFLPMKFILDNIFLTYDIIHYAKQSKQLLLFLKLDVFKTYEKVDLGFLFLALAQMGFPSKDGYILGATGFAHHNARFCAFFN